MGCDSDAARRRHGSAPPSAVRATISRLIGQHTSLNLHRLLNGCSAYTSMRSGAHASALCVDDRLASAFGCTVLQLCGQSCCFKPAREASPCLRNRLATWVLTVFLRMPRIAAISRLLLPCAAQWPICCSRSVYLACSTAVTPAGHSRRCSAAANGCCSASKAGSRLGAAISGTLRKLK